MGESNRRTINYSNDIGFHHSGLSKRIENEVKDVQLLKNFLDVF